MVFQEVTMMLLGGFHGNSGGNGFKEWNHSAVCAALVLLFIQHYSPFNIIRLCAHIYIYFSTED